MAQRNDLPEEYSVQQVHRGRPSVPTSEVLCLLSSVYILVAQPKVNLKKVLQMKRRAHFSGSTLKERSLRKSAIAGAITLFLRLLSP